MRVMFAGGGTGGHLYPALAVAEELSSRQPSFEALFVGTRRGIEARVVPQTGFDLRYISARGVRGMGIAGKAVTAAMLVVGVAQSIGIISRFRPDLVFGSGGYASVAAVSAAWLSGKTIVLQEQNSVPGLANRMLAPMAKRIYLGFEKAGSYFKKGTPLLVTGNPLRRSIRTGGAAEARKVFGLSEDAPVLFVFGGSQGAKSLSMAAAGYILARKDLQAIVQTGTSSFDEVASLLKDADGRVYVSPYIDEIEKAYSASDIALARAGALSVSELAAAGLPSVLVPYPHSADDHQTRNAEVLVDAGGAVMLKDRDLDARTLARVMDPIIDDADLRAGMRESLAKLPGSSAAMLIADDIEALTGPAGAEGRGKR